MSESYEQMTHFTLAGMSKSLCLFSKPLHVYLKKLHDFKNARGGGGGSPPRIFFFFFLPPDSKKATEEGFNVPARPKIDKLPGISSPITEFNKNTHKSNTEKGAINLA